MSTVVFLGPTLPLEEAQRHLQATYLPPVAQGDVFRVAREEPAAIGIIDGYFESIPPVWHKEILWAMAQGIHVFGASSMGALRAAELARFGMRGIGAIYEAFRSGNLEDDDEVAVAHGDASTGYRMASEAMVNIRATLRRAQDDGVISEALRRRLEALGKGLFYPERSYARLFASAREEGLRFDDLDRLEAFVATRRVDQKRADALLLLDEMNRCVSTGSSARDATYTFEHTDTWDRLVAWAEVQPALGEGPSGTPASLVAAEVRLLGHGGQVVLAAAVARAAAGSLARHSGAPGRQARAALTDRRLRAEHGGRDERGFEGWLERQGMTASEYVSLVDRETDMEWLRMRFRHEIDAHVLDELRLTTDFSRLAARAREKEALLATRGLGEPSLGDAGIDAPELLRWYFENCLRRPAPSNLESHLTKVGLPDVGALQREALREYLYARLSESKT